ncbi:MAG TPA: hypothetical protein VHI31_06860 [Actinomycetota bacterium]|nr:hypothetical protein [Actinomycetota bacterium]
MSSPIRTTPLLIALAILFVLGACTTRTSAEQTLEALGSSPKSIVTPTASPSPTGQVSPAVLEEIPGPAPGAGSAGGGVTARSTTPKGTARRAPGSVPASESEEPAEADPEEAPASGPDGSEPGQSAPGGSSGSGGNDASTGDRGGASFGGNDSSQGAGDGDDGDPGREEDDDD